jgi:hypothetical protein
MNRLSVAIAAAAVVAGCGGVSSSAMEERVELRYRDSGIAGASSASARCDDAGGGRFRCEVEVFDADGVTVCNDTIEAKPESGDNYAELSTRDGCG